MFKRINAIGIELEQGWKKQRDDLTEDIGIRLGDFKNSACCGELVSKPIDSLDKAITWLRENYGDETQEMCSMHLHLSFKDLDTYVALMNPAFKDYFLAHMKHFGETYPINNEHFWSRLEDKNKFCKNRIDHNQIFETKKVHNDNGRYTVLNFCFGRFKTIESRLLPTFISVDTAVAALEATVEAFESYLEKNPPAPIDLTKQFLLDEMPPDSEIDLTEDFSDGKPKKLKTKPFNLFMAKGAVPEAKYGLKEFYKQEKKNNRKSKTVDMPIYASGGYLKSSEMFAIKSRQMKEWKPVKAPANIFTNDMIIEESPIYEYKPIYDEVKEGF